MYYEGIPSALPRLLLVNIIRCYGERGEDAKREGDVQDIIFLVGLLTRIENEMMLEELHKIVLVLEKL
jgi:hypothetical protein